MKKLLFIRYKKPGKILEGGEVQSKRTCDILGQLLGAENVHPFYINDETKKKTAFDYAKGVANFFRFYFFGLTKSRVDEILALSKDFDYIFIDRSVFGIIAKRLKEIGYKGKIICFFHNVEVPYFKAKIPVWAPWRWLVLKCVDKNDEFSCRYADTIIALNARDFTEIKARYNRAADVLIPVALKDTYQREAYSQELTFNKPKCLFLGTYFPANADGIKWFIQHVYPKVNIQLTIVGKGMNQLKTDLSLPKEIKLISDVPDLIPYLEDADIMVLPIFKGSGMKVKTCESLMYGKNIIGTTEAFEGYELDFDLVGGCCNTEEEFIEKLQDYEANSRPKFNQYARSVFLTKYSESSIVGLFRQVLM